MAHDEVTLADLLTEDGIKPNKGDKDENQALIHALRGLGVQTITFEQDVVTASDGQYVAVWDHEKQRWYDETQRRPDENDPRGRKAMHDETEDPDCNVQLTNAEKDCQAILEDWLDANNAHHMTSKTLKRLLKDLGYGDRRTDPTDAFIDDNPGAIELLLTFITNEGDKPNNPWRTKLLNSIGEDEQE
jgi:hypothetical protein